MNSRGRASVEWKLDTTLHYTALRTAASAPRTPWTSGAGHPSPRNLRHCLTAVWLDAPFIGPANPLHSYHVLGTLRSRLDSVFGRVPAAQKLNKVSSRAANTHHAYYTTLLCTPGYNVHLVVFDYSPLIRIHTRSYAMDISSGQRRPCRSLMSTGGWRTWPRRFEPLPSFHYQDC